MATTDELIEAVRNMHTPRARAVDPTYVDGFNDALDDVVALLEEMVDEESKSPIGDFV